jgi:hypothetical protein
MKLLRILKISLILLLISNIALADDPTILQLGDKAPYIGLLFSPTKANELRQGLLERDYYLKINDSLNKSIDLQQAIINDQNNKINLLITQDDSLAKNLQSERNVSEWTKAAYFLLGIAATVGAGYAIKRAGQ